MTWNSITRDELLRWSSDVIDADGRLPELLARLIIETCPGVVFLDAPAGTGVGTSGFDLIVETRQESLFVPEGVSVWETSVRADSNPKAEEDYEKRSDGPGGLPADQTHYRAVSSRQWTKRKDFDGHDGDRIWKSVRGLNVESLVSWLSIAPATTVWMKGVLGSAVAGQVYWAAWWSRWLESTSVQLDESVLLSGRDDVSDRICFLAGEPGVTAFGGDGLQWDAAVATFAAVAKRAHDADPFATLPARLVIFDERGPFLAAVSAGRPLVAVIPDPEWLGNLPEHSKAHIFAFTRPSHLAALDIPPIDSDGAGRALEHQGVPFARAYDLGALARRDLTTLRRELAIQPALFTPAWARRELTTAERRVALLPTWNSNFSGDRSLVAELLGLAPASIADEWASLFQEENRPIASFGHLHYQASPTDVWRLASRSLTSGDLDKYAYLAQSALATPDPLAELAGGERLRAQFQGVKAEYSKEMAQGIGVVLALMGSDPPPGTSAPQTALTATSIVTAALLTGSGPMHPKELRTRPIELALWAEASPDAVLEYVRQIANGVPATEIFTDQRGRSVVTFDSASPHLEIVRVLGIIAWSSDYLARAVDLLLQLHAVDPGGSWANRPLSALVDALSPASQNTSTSWEERLGVVHHQLTTNTERSWSAFAGLVSQDGAGLVEPGPRYRKWGPRARISTFDEVVDRRNELVHELLPFTETSSQMVSAVDWLDSLDGKGIAEVVLRIRTQSRAWGDDEKAPVFAALRSLIARHSEFSDAWWALPAEVLAQLAELRDELLPSDPRAKHLWLFDEGYPTLGDFDRRNNWEAHTAEVEQRRITALDEIQNVLGFEKLVEFLITRKDPSIAARVLAARRRPLTDDELQELIADDRAGTAELAMSYVDHRGAVEPALPVRLLSRLPDVASEIRANLIRVLPIAQAMKTLDAESEEVVSAYWENFSPFHRELDQTLLDSAITALITHNRAGLAVTLVDLQEDDASAEQITRVLQALILHGSGGSVPEAQTLDALVSRVAADPDLVDVAAQIEWAVLPALDDDRQLALHRQLARNPQFFAEVVEASLEGDGEKRHRAWTLLRSWSTVPGADSDGVIDGAELRNWLEECETAITSWDADRKRSALGLIGEMLSRSAPNPSDGIWPQTSVRDVVNGLSDDAVEEGIERGLYNARGIQSRDPQAGGASERSLAALYRERASALPADDRTAAILRQLAIGYESEGKNQDYRAEVRRRGLGW